MEANSQILLEKNRQVKCEMKLVKKETEEMWIYQSIFKDIMRYLSDACKKWCLKYKKKWMNIYFLLNFIINDQNVQQIILIKF